MNGRRHKREIEAAEDDALELVKTRGLRAAAHALISVCEDPNATAQAKATAGRTICEVTGMLKKAAKDREPEAMDLSIDQIRALIADVDRAVELNEAQVDVEEEAAQDSVLD